MFEDFDRKAEPQGRGRMGVSVLISGGMFLLIASALGAAIATARAVVRKHDRETDVSFADLPAAPKPKAVVTRRAGELKVASTKRPMTSVKKIPQERPEEAEGDLAADADPGAVDGIVEAKPAPPPPAPPPQPPPVQAKPAPPPPPAPEQQRESIEAPRYVSGCRAPEVPEALLANAVTIRIEVQMTIDARGRVIAARVMESHPLVPDEVVLRCAREQVFEPAHLPDGTAVPYPFRRRFVFKPAQA